MLRREDGNYFCGPFVEARSLDGCWSELAKIAIQLGGHYQEFFDLTSREAAIAKAEYLALQNDWLERFFGNAPFDKAKIAEIRVMAEGLPSRP